MTDQKSAAVRLDFDALAPKFSAAMVRLDSAAGVDLDPELRELVRIHAFTINCCAYCVDMHAGVPMTAVTTTDLPSTGAAAALLPLLTPGLMLLTLGLAFTRRRDAGDRVIPTGSVTHPPAACEVSQPHRTGPPGRGEKDGGSV